MRRDFFHEIVSLEPPAAAGDSEYGSRVMPVLELHKTLASYEARRGFQDALEKMLTDDRESVRRFAVDICLGFFVFRNAI